jgi:hypothetical protein
MDRSAALAVGALLLAALAPTDLWGSLPALCPSRWIGRSCPGCGMTRALSLLLHGQVQQAIRANPRVLPVTAILVWLALRPLFAGARQPSESASLLNTGATGQRP